MRNIFFSIVGCFLIIFGVFGLCPNLIFALTVITGEATDVTSNSATLNGTVSNGRSPSEWFEYGTVSGSYDKSTHVVSVFPFEGTETVSIGICGLSTATTYYYRIAAYENTPGGPGVYPDAYGSEMSFITLAATPTVAPTHSPNLTPVAETGEAEVYETSVILNGTVNANGLSTAAWFEYGAASGVYNSTTSKQTICGSTDTPVIIRTDRLPNTFYYRIVAQNSAGTTYGSEKFFTTLATPTLIATPTPTVVPTPVCNVKSMEVSPKKLTLKRGKSREVTVSLYGKKDCSPEDKIVNVTINNVGRKLISITPASHATDVNGTVKFTITAMNKIGNAKVVFETDSLKKLLTVKVRR